MLNNEFCLTVYNVINEKISSVIYDIEPTIEEIEKLINEKNGFSASIEERFYISK